MTYQVDILNPKAEKLLHDLAALNLIALSQPSANQFIDAVKALRKKASIKPPTMDEITREVEAVRSKRYAKKIKA